MVLGDPRHSIQVYSQLGKPGGSVRERCLSHAIAPPEAVAEGAAALRSPRWVHPFAVLTLAAACGTGGNSPAHGNTMLDPTSHAPFFPIAAGSKHALGSDSPAITCNSCHGGTATFQQFDCLSCHQHSDPAALALGHGSLSQFAYASASCYSCHPRGTASGAVPSGLISDPARDLTVNAQIPSYVETSISSLSAETETLPMPMDHSTTKVDPTAFASCGNCHVDAAAGAYYPGNFHSSLANLNLPQPASCVDCHANSRPSAVLTSANSTMAAGLVFDHTRGPALSDCVSCHVNTSAAATQWTSWSQGKFHLPGSASPATCLPCHAGERPVSTTGWVSTTYRNSPFDYGTNSSGITHGDGQDCASCHRGPGTGIWGSTQNWSAGYFTHGLATISGTTCMACHVSQRPTTVVP